MWFLTTFCMGKNDLNALNMDFEKMNIRGDNIYNSFCNIQCTQKDQAQITMPIVLHRAAIQHEFLNLNNSRGVIENQNRTCWHLCWINRLVLLLSWCVTRELDYGWLGLPITNYVCVVTCHKQRDKYPTYVGILGLVLRWIEWCHFVLASARHHIRPWRWQN